MHPLEFFSLLHFVHWGILDLWDYVDRALELQVDASAGVLQSAAFCQQGHPLLHQWKLCKGSVCPALPHREKKIPPTHSLLIHVGNVTVIV